MVLVHITKKSNNRKVGPIPTTTTEAATCPPSCPFINSGCYAKSGPLALHWHKVSNGTQSNLTDWDGLCSFIEQQPPGQLIRLQQAGDLPHQNGVIDTFLLRQLVKANKGRKSYSYTHHKHTPHNIKALQQANELGLTINVSTESLEAADYVVDSYGLPAVTVVNSKDKPPKTTPGGRRVVVCPAQVKDGVTCSTCKLCSKQRSFIVAFIAHGTQKNKVNEVLS